MNPIRSNYEGRNIHSPFAFHLVSEVIFGKAGFENEDWCINSNKFDDNKQKYGLLFRLLRFFIPDRITIQGSATEGLELLISKYNKPENPLNLSSVKEFQVQSSEFVIWIDIHDQKYEVPCNISESIWFMFDIQQNKMREFFEKLKLNTKVTQTYELNSCGIVIFNPKFQKQDFVINGKKSY